MSKPMNDTQLEELLRSARPEEASIPPLAPDKAEAIFARALAQSGVAERTQPWWQRFLAPAVWKPAMVAACGIAGAMVFFVKTGPLDVQQTTMPPVVSSPIVAEDNKPEGDGVDPPSQDRALSPMGVRPKAQKATSAVASVSKGGHRSRRHSGKRHGVATPPVSQEAISVAQEPELVLATRKLPLNLVAPVAGSTEEEPELKVAASNVEAPESDGELSIAVRENVPTDAPGRAEAAAVRIAALTDSPVSNGMTGESGAPEASEAGTEGASPVATALVWAQASVENGAAEATVTYSAFTAQP